MKKLHKIYPWETWFTKKFFFLVRGRDYTCNTKGMTQQIRNRATENYHRVAIRVEEHQDTEIILVVNRTLLMEQKLADGRKRNNGTSK